MDNAFPQDEVSRKGISLLPFFLLMTFLNLFFNLSGLPYVKQAYIGQTLVLILMIFTSDQRSSFWALVIFSLFEGQGRVVMGYQVIYRLIFDILIGLLVVRAIISEKKLINKEILPNYLIVGIFLHFIWFLLELFNPNGAGIFPGLATTKVYIFPFLLFFYFQNFPINFIDGSEQRFLFLFTIILFFCALIVIIQAQNDENFLYGISTNYRDLFSKYKDFTNSSFRPWGLSFLPGGMGVLFFLTMPFLFFFNPKLIYPNSAPARAFLSLFKWSTFAMIGYSSFVSQVRSATLKLFLLFGLFMLAKFIGSKLKFRRLLTIFGFIVLMSLSLPYTSGLFNLSGDASVDRAMARYEGLADTGFLANRASLDTFTNIFEERIELPFGYGVGMLSGFLPDFEVRRKSHVDIPKNWWWHFDNLFLFLFLELGLGALIYIFILFAVNLSLVSRWLTLLRWGELNAFAIVGACAILVFLVTGFNWGAVGIPFNPESFFYWFWAGTGFKVYKMTKDKRGVSEGPEKLGEGDFDSFEEREGSATIE